MNNQPNFLKLMMFASTNICVSFPYSLIMNIAHF